MTAVSVNDCVVSVKGDVSDSGQCQRLCAQFAESARGGVTVMMDGSRADRPAYRRDRLVDDGRNSEDNNDDDYDDDDDDDDSGDAAAAAAAADGGGGGDDDGHHDNAAADNTSDDDDDDGGNDDGGDESITYAHNPYSAGPETVARRRTAET